MRLDAAPHTTVTVIATDETLVEYDDADDTRLSDIVGVKYIEARSDSDFKMVVTVDRALFVERDYQDVICCHIVLDGMYAEGVLIERRAPGNGKIVAQVVGKHNNARNTLERFRFADLETSKFRF